MMAAVLHGVVVRRCDLGDTRWSNPDVGEDADRWMDGWPGMVAWHQRLWLLEGRFA